MKNFYGDDIKIITWDEYFNKIPTSKVYNTVTEYNVHLGYDGDSTTASVDSTYARDVAFVEKLVNPKAYVRRMFVRELERKGSALRMYETSLDECMRLVSLIALDQFCEVDKMFLIDLEDGSYVYAPCGEDQLQLKKLAEDEGALVIYTPKKFVRFTLRGKVGESSN